MVQIILFFYIAVHAGKHGIIENSECGEDWKLEREGTLGRLEPPRFARQTEPPPCNKSFHFTCKEFFVFFST